MSTPDNAGAAIIEPDQARAFLKADAANLAKRLKAGHPLSAAERKHLGGLAAGGKDPDPSFVASVLELADLLNVERKTLQRWRKVPGSPEPRADGRWDVAAWRAFKATRRAGERDGEAEGSTDSKEENARLKNEKLALEIAIIKHDYIERAEVERWVAGMILTAKGVLFGMPSSLAPQVVGVSIPEAEALIRDVVNETIAQLHGDPIRGLADLGAKTAEEETAL